MGRTGGNLSCVFHGSVFIPGSRECVGCCAGEKPNDRGRRREEIERKREKKGGTLSHARRQDGGRRAHTRTGCV